MDNDVLQKQIHIIFDREKILLDNNTIPWSVDNSNEDKKMIYDHSNTLVNLYMGLQGSELKEIYIDTLLHTFVNGREKIKVKTKNQWDYYLSSYSSTGALIFSLYFS